MRNEIKYRIEENAIIEEMKLQSLIISSKSLLTHFTETESLGGNQLMSFCL